MERVRERLATARRALGSLEAALREPKSDISRDAAIQRFEYTFEAVWKAAQIYLKRVEGQETGSPKGAIRMSYQVGVLTEEQAKQAMQMADDRNLTVHTYREELAEEIHGRLAGYAGLMGGWLGRMESGSGRGEL